MSFIILPTGDVVAVPRIGAVKALEGGLLVLGVGDDIVAYVECTAPIAIEWRDQLIQMLTSYRPHKHMNQVNWLDLAAAVDEVWATEHGWSALTAD